MYGTIARLQAKPGMEDRLKDQVKEFESAQVPGAIASYVFQADADSSEYWLVALFDSRDSYWANAQSPEQDARYRKLRDLLLDEPEWHDGEVVAALEYAGTRTRQGGRH